MRKYTFLLISLLILPLFIRRCDIINQATQVISLVNCDFRIHSVENINLAGVNVQHINDVKQLSLADAARLMTAVIGNTFPLSFQLNFEARNPNTTPAGMNQLEYIIFIDDIRVASGNLHHSFTIPPNNGTAIIPMQITTNLKEILNGESLQSIVNFGLNLVGAGNEPTRFMVKLKPSILINGQPINYPGYITVRTKYSSY